ncbi:ClpXP protease specificity-enhancing factor [Spiribacter sp. C176]|uniref:ClpXP protease specificity-enhancing factor n=1 Tax=Spiribacter salilacus TaxID=2664894 RepID=A0A6N7QU30_9GAMM|nr:ClpXP protease specificity-enhancing factor [Spiribacter salilacus]MRH78658.1 ClpXP protease specificity-enhancing factor [Spiribacter salilacus]
MTPSRPYLLRALHEWIVDNGLTPHLLINVMGEGVNAPQEFAEGGRLVLNISPSAVGSLTLGNEFVELSARFGGVPHQVTVPIAEVLAIYARENGRGMVFSEEEGDPPPPAPSRPGLRVVK